MPVNCPDCGDLKAEIKRLREYKRLLGYARDDLAECQKQRDDWRAKFEMEYDAGSMDLMGAQKWERISERYRAALIRAQSAAGNPDPAEGCRLVIQIAKETLED